MGRNPYNYEATFLENTNKVVATENDCETLKKALMALHLVSLLNNPNGKWASIFIIKQIDNDGNLMDAFVLEATEKSVHKGHTDLRRYCVAPTANLN